MEWWGWFLWGFLIFFGISLARYLLEIVRFNIDRLKEK